MYVVKNSEVFLVGPLCYITEHNYDLKWDDQTKKVIGYLCPNITDLDKLKEKIEKFNARVAQLEGELKLLCSKIDGGDKIYDHLKNSIYAGMWKPYGDSEENDIIFEEFQEQLWTLLSTIHYGGNFQLWQKLWTILEYYFDFKPQIITTVVFVNQIQDEVWANVRLICMSDADQELKLMRVSHCMNEAEERLSFPNTRTAKAFFQEVKDFTMTYLEMDHWPEDL